MRAVTTLSPRHIAALDRLPALVARLVEIGTPEEIVQARHDAKALRSLAKKCRFGRDAANTAAEATLRFERQLGEMGRPKKVVSPDSFRLDDLGISRDLSSRAQKIAAIPAATFEAYFRAAWTGGTTWTDGIVPHWIVTAH